MFSQDFGAKMSISYRSQSAVPRFGTNNTQSLGNKKKEKKTFLCGKNWHFDNICSTFFGKNHHNKTFRRFIGGGGGGFRRVLRPVPLFS